MSNKRKALVVFGVCAVLYLVVLPAVPDTGGVADDLIWLLGVLVALTGTGALVIAYRLPGSTVRRTVRSDVLPRTDSPS